MEFVVAAGDRDVHDRGEFKTRKGLKHTKARIHVPEP
jgi:hypothetical protein